MTIRGGTEQQRALGRSLVSHGLLLETGVAGVFGQSAGFVDLAAGVSRVVRTLAEPEDPLRWAFPAVMPRRYMEAVGYLRSFPHLAGSVWGFEGDERAAHEMAERVEAGEDWSGALTATDLVLVPAACHPVYPALAARGPLAAGGITVDTGPAAVFRHEPSTDPSRMQAFHMHELVRVAPPEAVLAWRDEWRDRSAALLVSLGLQPATEEANDPFFGRAGRLLAANQRSQALKFELVVEVVGTPVAVASFNYHREHFSDLYRLVGEDGELHTACLGFGLERLVIALLATHGMQPAQWPAAVQEVLAA